MSLIFHPMDEANARTLISWRYDPPYDIYTIPASTVEEVSFLTDPHNAYYSIHNEDGMLEAFCCFGADAYAVTLDDYAVRAEVTATERAGFLRFTFPATDAAWVLVQPNNTPRAAHTSGDAYVRVIPERCEIVGYNPAFRYSMRAGGVQRRFCRPLQPAVRVLRRVERRRGEPWWAGGVGAAGGICALHHQCR